MTDRDSAGARWMREDAARRAREKAEQDRARQARARDALARARAAAEQARQDAFDPAPTLADEERALLGRILAEPDARVRERLEGALRALRERAARRPPGPPRR